MLFLLVLNKSIVTNININININISKLECAIATIENGYVDLFRFYMSPLQYCPKKTMLLLCNQAVISGNLEILQLTWRQNFKRSKKYSLLNTAVKNGHLDMLKWLHGKGCPYDENTSVAAVAYKHIEIFKWLHEIGCECCVIGCQYCGE